MHVATRRKQRKPVNRWHTIPPKIRARRKALIRSLGGQCTGCGSTRWLEFHHKQARTWVARSLSQTQRMNKYEEEAEQDLIELKCGFCNKRLGKPGEEPETTMTPEERSQYDEEF